MVFDAREPPPDANPHQRHQQITVLFAPDSGDADEVIEDLVRRHPSPRQLIVVSSDHRLQKAVLKRSGKAVDSEVWLQQLDCRPRAGSSPAPVLAAADPGRNLDDWQQEFGEFSVDELAAEVAAESPGAAPKEDWDQHVDLLERQLSDPAELERWLDDPRANGPRKQPPPPRK